MLAKINLKIARKKCDSGRRPPVSDWIIYVDIPIYVAIPIYIAIPIFVAIPIYVEVMRVAYYIEIYTKMLERDRRLGLVRWRGELCPN